MDMLGGLTSPPQGARDVSVPLLTQVRKGRSPRGLPHGPAPAPSLCPPPNPPSDTVNLAREKETQGGPGVCVTSAPGLGQEVRAEAAARFRRPRHRAAPGPLGRSGPSQLPSPPGRAESDQVSVRGSLTGTPG